MTINENNDILSIKKEPELLTGTTGHKLEEISNMNQTDRTQRITKWTKIFLDVMFYSGIAVTGTLPLTVKWIGGYIAQVKDNYGEIVMIYFVLGIAALVIVRELRRMFGTVLKHDCFARENVISLRKMGKWSFFIVLMSIVRTVVYATAGMLVIILVFTIAGLFSRVLANVFEEAIIYKEENELTI